MSWVITGSEKTPVDPQFGSVSLLLHGDGTNGSTTITDNSPTPKTVTAVGNAQISTTQSKFGGSSIAFDGTGDYLTVPADAGFAFNGNTENFTIEFWSYYTGPSSGVNNAQIVGNLPPTSSVGGSGAWLIATQGNNYRWFTSLGQGGFDMTLTPNQWEHVAVVCNSAAIKMYVNGIGSPWTMTSNINYFAIAPLAIGAFNNAFLTGYIDDLRITKGVARYTANFTPPTAPFPDI
jgi:hypothetical protein